MSFREFFSVSVSKDYTQLELWKEGEKSIHH